MFEQIGAFDALITVVGNDSVFKPYADLAEADYLYGFKRKFLGQIRLLKLGEPFVRDKGVFVFSSGFLSHYPHPMSCATGPLNAAVDLCQYYRPSAAAWYSPQCGEPGPCC